MQTDDFFIGTGRNPKGPDLPLGLGMRLAQSPGAIETYASLTNAEKASVIRYVQSGQTGDEAKNKITEAVQRLAEGDHSF